MTCSNISVPPRVVCSPGIDLESQWHTHHIYLYRPAAAFRAGLPVKER